MKQGVSFTPAEELRWTGTFGLPLQLLGQARERVRLVALLGVGGFAAFLAYGFTRNLIEEGFLRRNAFNFIGDACALAIAALLYAAARSSRVGVETFLNAALAASIAVCSIISIVAPWYYAINSGSLPHVTWVSAIIILVPLLLPIPPKRTMLVSVASALTVPAGLFALQVSGIVHPDFQAYVLLGISPAIAVIIAVTGSREIYGINRKLVAAQRIAGYTLGEKIGEGGMGEVWSATHRLLSRPSAIKLIRGQEVAGSDPRRQEVTMARFEREAKAIAALRSPHTISLYDFGVSEDGRLYYAMELLTGMDLESLAAETGPLPAGRVVFLVRQACESLAEAHDQGLVHRDIKPSNLFVCRYPRYVDFLKVLDFGIAKVVGDAATGVTWTGSGRVGSANFIAPEQASGGGTEDARTDIYSLGCVMYWLLTGEIVFEATTPAETMRLHLDAAPVPPKRRSPAASIPRVMEDLVMSCLEKDPRRRPRSMDEVSATLAGVALDRPWSTEQARAWWEPRFTRDT